MCSLLVWFGSVGILSIETPWRRGQLQSVSQVAIIHNHFVSQDISCLEVSLVICDYFFPPKPHYLFCLLVCSVVNAASI